MAMHFVGTGEDVTDKLPERLSPSRTSDFIQCPGKFYFKTILKLPTPSTVEQVRGTLTHHALELLFEEHAKGSRTPELAVPYIAPEWERMKEESDQYDHLLEKEQEILDYAEQMVHSYFGVEDPNKFDPVGNEWTLRSDIGGVDMLGIIDRVDKVTLGDASERYVISDYKTGKVPAANDRFLNEKFFAMQVYAVLLKNHTGEIPISIRLIYTKGGTPDSVRSQAVTNESAARTEKQIASIWKDMKNSSSNGKFKCKKQPLCNWCDFQNICPVFNPVLEVSEVPEDIN